MKKDEYSALKRFSIIQFLALTNCVPTNRAGREHYYISPLRHERSASFSVNELKNSWYDHGLGVGGNLLDLAMRLFDEDYKTTAANVAQIVANAEHLPAADADAEVRNRGTIEQVATDSKKLISSGSLRDGVLREYLVSRGISLAALQADGRVWSMLSEVRYTQRRKDGSLGRYFSIGIRNESGGVELFNKGFKSHMGSKDVTFIRGSQPGVAIFEGVMDFFSALTKRYKKFKGKATSFKCSVLILHSAKYAKRSLHLVQNAGSIFYYGDNDQTGIDLMHWYKKECKSQAFYAMNEEYRGYKDLNDSLLGKKPKDPLPARGQAASKKSQTAQWWLWVTFEWAGRKGKECVFFAYNNTAEGYERLLTLRNRLSEDAKVIRLCTRTSGREYTYEQLFCPTGACTVGAGGPWGTKRTAAAPRLRVSSTTKRTVA